MLMNAGLVCESIATHDRLVGRGAEADLFREQLACRIQTVELQRVRVRELVLAYLQGCGDLFKRGVACAFADAVDGALYLAHTGFDGSKCVRDREAKIIVAVRGKRDAVERHILAQAAEHVAVFLGQGVAPRCPAG